MRFLVEISENGFVKTVPLPARLGIDAAASILGIQKDDLSFLISKGALGVLGKPRSNQEKYLNAEEILAKAQDARWLSRSTDTLYKHHRERNSRKRKVS